MPKRHITGEKGGGLPPKMSTYDNPNQNIISAGNCQSDEERIAIVIDELT